MLILLQNVYPQNANVPHLFRPLTLRGVTFKNRIFVASPPHNPHLTLAKLCASLLCVNTAPITDMQQIGTSFTSVVLLLAVLVPFAWKLPP